MTRRSLIPVLLLLLLTACSFFKTTPAPQVYPSVAPLPASATPPPLPTPYPSPAPMTLAGLFCEYQFCIGHPTAMAFYDHLASLNPLTPSTYANGFLAAYQLPT